VSVANGIVLSEAVVGRKASAAAGRKGDDEVEFSIVWVMAYYVQLERVVPGGMDLRGDLGTWRRMVLEGECKGLSSMMEAS
jgi:hypothetical protein